MKSLVFTLAAALFLLTPAGATPSFSTAAAARAWGDRAERTGDYDGASQAFQVEAAILRRHGDTQGALVEIRRAKRLTTDVAFAIPSDSYRTPQPLARLEPARGCYIGVRDDFKGQYWGRPTANCENFADRIHHPVAVALDYQVYGRPFPTDWAVREARRGRALQIAWEPDNIGAVADNRYLNQWAQAAGQSRTPIFLRFGGEMNGRWTPWSRNPAAYRRAFRTVAAAMRRYAPNVAMVWAPNVVPLSNIDNYYPGDDVVDWVGVSLYIVRYYDDNPRRPAWQDSVENYVDPFYDKYAARKPLCIVETGVTRRSRLEGADADTFAAQRIVDLLDAVKIRYPRLKMICFFDRNNIAKGDCEGPAGRNDFSFPRGSQALGAVQDEMQDPYFLGSFDDDGAPYAYEPVDGALPAGYDGDVVASVSTYCLAPSLRVERGDDPVRTGRPFRFSVPNGDGPLAVSVYDANGHLAKSVHLAAP